MRPNPHQKHLLGQLDFLATAEQARARGKSLVLTSGDFDVLNASTLHQLRTAAKYGDILLVAVANDVQMPGLIYDAELRAARVAAMRWVDAVTITATPPEWFIDALLPEAWVWNGPPEADPGRAAVQQYQGRVVQLPQPKPVQRQMFEATSPTPDPGFAEHCRWLEAQVYSSLFGLSQPVYPHYRSGPAPLQLFSPAAD